MGSAWSGGWGPHPGYGALVTGLQPIVAVGDHDLILQHSSIFQEKPGTLISRSNLIMFKCQNLFYIKKKLLQYNVPAEVDGKVTGRAFGSVQTGVCVWAAPGVPSAL